MYRFCKYNSFGTYRKTGLRLDVVKKLYYLVQESYKGAQGSSFFLHNIKTNNPAHPYKIRNLLHMLPPPVVE